MENLDQISKIVVKVSTSEGSGSGFYIKSKNLIVTNHHVVAGQRFAAIEKQDKSRYTAKVIMIDPRLDVALLEPNVQLENMPDVQITQTNTLQNRDKVLVMGFPYGMSFTITEGIVSSIKQLVGNQDYIQTDSAINPGNSGGPLVSMNGEILGITTSKLENAESMGFAIPIESIPKEFDIFQKNKDKLFSVVCPSCETLIFKQEDFCPNCGQSLNKKFFLESRLNPLAQFVEEALKIIGIDPTATRDGFDYWKFYKGSALIRVFVYKNEFLYVTCPLVVLPKTNLQDIFSYILSSPLEEGFTFGLFSQENTIYLSYRVHLSDIENETFKEEIKNKIGKILKKSDEMDNFLIDKFSCEPSKHSKV